MERGDQQKLELLEKIDNYLSGDLPEDERIAFEAAIKADPALAKEVEMNRIVNKALKDEKLLSLQEDINESMKLIREISSSVEVDFDTFEISESDNKTRKIWPRVIAIAASVAIVLVSIFAIIQYQQSTSPDTLVAAYLEEPHKAPPFFKGPEENVESWAINYENGNYLGAKATLEKIVASDATSPETEFYLGLCYLYQETPDPQSAVQQFEKVLATNNRYNEQALWYLGLAYYLNHQQDLATETLRKITGYNQKEAASLLKKIE